MTVYIYGLHCPIADTIRYVGKSTKPRQRLRGHMSGARRFAYDHHTARWLRKLDDVGLVPEVVILHEVQEGERWQDIERALIASAPERGWELTNSTAGGEGLDFLDPEAERRYRERHARAMKAVWSRPEWRAEATKRLRAATSDPELIARRSSAIRDAYRDPAVRKRVAEASRRTGARPEVKAAKSAKTKAAWNDPAYRAVITAARNDPDFTAEQATRLRKRWADPVARKKMNNARWTPEKRREQAERIAAYNARRKEQANG